MLFNRTKISQDKLNAIKTFFDNGETDTRDILSLIEHAEYTMQYDGSMTLAQLQDEVSQWSRYNFPRNKDHHPLMGAVEELGELHHVRLKYEQGIRGYDADKYIADSEDAIADIIIYLADYCGRNGLDLQRAIDTVWPQVKERDWVKYPKNGRTE